MNNPASDSKPHIQLCEFPGVGLLIEWPSGVIYSSQTGGVACTHPQMEGIFIPLDYELSSPQKELERYFTGSKWQGSCYGGIDDETADFLDDLLKKSHGTQGLMVNRAKLEESEEAWIHVIVSPQGEETEVWRGFSNTPGVLTWLNGD